MGMLKTAAVGAGLVFLARKVSEMDAVQKMSPTIAENAPYLAGAALLVAAKHFNLA